MDLKFENSVFELRLTFIFITWIWIFILYGFGFELGFRTFYEYGFGLKFLRTLKPPKKTRFGDLSKSPETHPNYLIWASYLIWEANHKKEQYFLFFAWCIINLIEYDCFKIMLLIIEFILFYCIL